MIAEAKASGSPAMEALVRGHLASGHIAMALLAMHLPSNVLEPLDEAFAKAKDDAAALGVLNAIGYNGDSVE